MLVTLLMPISAIFMSIIFLGESIATQHIIGLIFDSNWFDISGWTNFAKI